MTSRRLRRGATAIEFAMLFPVFFLLLTGIVDGGWLFWQHSALDLALHDGCRTGSMRDPGIGLSDMATVASVATEDIQTQMNFRGLRCDDCDIAVDSVTTATEDAIQCTVNWDWSSLTGMIPSAELRSSITMRLEMQR